MFADVPVTSPFCRWIEELARRGVVSGCGGGNYCPTGPATREQMAVFVLRTLDPALNPPACGTPVFADVPATSPFCRWIEELARRGVVTGCGGGNYCPTAAVTREQMSVFLAVTFGAHAVRACRASADAYGPRGGGGPYRLRQAAPTRLAFRAPFPSRRSTAAQQPVHPRAPRAHRRGRREPGSRRPAAVAAGGEGPTGIPTSTSRRTPGPVAAAAPDVGGARLEAGHGDPRRTARTRRVYDAPRGTPGVADPEPCR